MPRFFCCAAAFALAAAAFAQSPPKRPLTHADYEIWNQPTGVTVSRDGKWIAYSAAPGEGDGAVVVRHMESGKEYRFARGGRPALPTGAPGALPLPVTGLAGSPAFSPDGRTLFAPLTPTTAEVEKARAEKKRPDEMPKAALAVIDLSSGKVVERIEKLRGFAVIGDGAGFLVQQMERKPDAPAAPPSVPGAVIGGPGAAPQGPPAPMTPTPGATQPPAGPRGPVRRQPGGTPPAAGTAPTIPTTPQFGSDLIIKNLSDGKAVTVPDVLGYSVTRDQKTLLLTVKGKKDDADGLYVMAPGDAAPTAIKAGKGDYKNPTWDWKQTKLAFFFAETAPKPDPMAKETVPAPKPRVYLWDRGTKAPAVELLGATVAGMPADMQLTDRGLGFSYDGLKLGLVVGPEEKPKPKPPAATTPAAADERVDLDLWHWKDELIQPMQKVRTDPDTQKNRSAAYFFDTKQFRQLSDDTWTVGVPDVGDWSVASNDKPYRYLTGYGGSPRDYAAVNVRTGEKKPLLTAHDGAALGGLGGKNLTYFAGKQWHTLNLLDGKTVNLTAKLGVAFHDEEQDTPDTVRPYGIAGETNDGKFILIHDRFDVWKLALDGTTAENLTKIGRKAGVELRRVRIADGREDPERGIDLTKPLLLAATNLHTQDTGFYRLDPGAKEPKLLTMAPRKFGPPTKARNADVYVMTASTFKDYPDYYATTPDFKEFKRVTDINPRTKEFNWGTAELVRYKSADGVPLSGVLVKPENFDATKKYPMMVYIYERLTDTVHNFRLPSYGTSINPTYYASNGYLVFMPDIAYTVGAPGQSALKCVLPAIQSVVDLGCVDEANIGIQGHSWGGYQIAYLVTQTTRFKAAEAGAPVANMTSAYGGIRWGTGLPRQFQYERTQSRIGATLWAAPMKYLENSPVFMADRVQTPLLILHNDQDDAVPWYQGIEYYLALRRLGKEVYLFNYNGEFHGLRRKATQKDYTVRMQQFFDHHLKGTPMPAWMKDGVKFADREKEKDAIKGLFKPPEKK